MVNYRIIFKINVGLKLDLLATLLLKLEKEGKLDEIKKRARREVQ